MLHQVTNSLNSVMNSSHGAGTLPFSMGASAEVIKHEHKPGGGSFPFAVGTGGMGSLGGTPAARKASDKKKWMKRI